MIIKAEDAMTVTLPLQPNEEAKLLELAESRGLSTDALLLEAIKEILEKVPDHPIKPKKSAYGLLERYGPGPTAEEIDENRREMFSGFAKDF
jgi:hypothetical protein